MMAMEGDSSKLWMNTAWTQKTFRDVEKDPSLLIIEYCVKDIGSKGDNYMSHMQLISIRLQRTGNKDSEMFLVVNNVPQGREVQKLIIETPSYPNEIKIFSHVFPKFQDILEAIVPGRFKPFAARHIFSQNNFPYFLIVNDLASEGFRIATRQHSLDIDHCLLIARTLGSVEDVRLVDFQQVVYSSCVIDLQHFIITSPSEEVRVAHTENILKECHKELCLTLQLLGQAKKAISSQ
ncbi:hypothetical protein PR048_000840 [Dryococelus australis]|uniref:Uncharacterized protein n=1 Tax=Dryococelus australis TaxID=614101 RepID=A0ABQ9IGC1_9NEOP|nr:hypothetical protein PR048_000840 [Dryococelus australis]